jgi:hypothetical protein
MASISPSALRRPNAINDATRTDMGMDRASIHAALRKNSSSTTFQGSPLDRMESRIWTTKSTRKRPVMTTSA